MKISNRQRITKNVCEIIFVFPVVSTSDDVSDQTQGSFRLKFQRGRAHGRGYKEGLQF